MVYSNVFGVIALTSFLFLIVANKKSSLGYILLFCSLFIHVFYGGYLFLVGCQRLYDQRAFVGVSSAVVTSVILFLVSIVTSRHARNMFFKWVQRVRSEVRGLVFSKNPYFWLCVLMVILNSWGFVGVCGAGSRG